MPRSGVAARLGPCPDRQQRQCQCAAPKAGRRGTGLRKPHQDAGAGIAQAPAIQRRERERFPAIGVRGATRTTSHNSAASRTRRAAHEPPLPDPKFLPTQISPYDRLAWSDARWRRCLPRAAIDASWKAISASMNTESLQTGARTHMARRSQWRSRVIIIPGIMGSQLGLARAAPLPNDLLWLDPMDITAGRLSAV